LIYRFFQPEIVAKVIFLRCRTKCGVDKTNDKDYLSQHRIVESNTQVFGTTLLTLLPVFLPASAERGLFFA
jgi:hypothetical protein